MKRRCQIENCSLEATEIVRVGGDLLYLCPEHYAYIQQGLKEIQERVKHMTPEELEARLEELNKEDEEKTRH